MIIKFTKKVRQGLLMAITLIFILGGGVFLLKDEKTEETIKIQEDSLNQYSIDVIFEEESKRLMCNQTLTYVNNTGTELDKIYLHIYPNAFSKKEFAPFEKSEMKDAYPNGFNEGYIDIQNVLNNGEKLENKITGDKDDILEINLGRKLKDNEKISIDLKYTVKLPNCLGRFGYGQNTINATNWFPIACVYDDRGWNLKGYESVGDPFYSDTSDFKVNILMPRKYQVGSTGKVINEKMDDEKIFYEIEAKKVRDFAFILSDKFDKKSDSYKGILINTYNLNSEFSDYATDVAKDSIEIFSELFGKYPYDTYSVVASDFYIGGMEYPNLVMIDQSVYNTDKKFIMEYIIAHETAHQWWYSVIGNDEISEPWIDEALTEYSTVLYFEKKYGKDISKKLMETMEVQSKNYRSHNMFKATTEYKDSIEYSLNVYTKGAVIFDEIRSKVGDEVFFATLQEYYSKYMYENVNGAKFVEVWKEKGIDIDKIISECK
ncbi:MAG: M1 family metallopeptidase [Peptostreptococcaceae bacterium]